MESRTKLKWYFGLFFLFEVLFGHGGLYGLLRGGRTFGGLGIQVQPDGSSVSYIFESSFTEEGTVEVRYIFEMGFKFSSSEASKKFDNTALADQGVIGGQLDSKRSRHFWQFMINKKYSKESMRILYSLTLRLHVMKLCRLTYKIYSTNAIQTKIFLNRSPYWLTRFICIDGLSMKSN